MRANFDDFLCANAWTEESGHIYFAGKETIPLLPSIFLMPKSLCIQWCSQINRFTAPGSFRLIDYAKKGSDRISYFSQSGGYNELVIKAGFPHRVIFVCTFPVRHDPSLFIIPMLKQNIDALKNSPSGPKPARLCPELQPELLVADHGSGASLRQSRPTAPLITQYSPRGSFSLRAMSSTSFGTPPAVKTELLNSLATR